MKVFGIGLNKTGTTTLGVCLKQLGYRHSSFNLSLLEHIAVGNWDPLWTEVEEYESFEDWPYPLIFEQLHQRYPGSRFILSRRSSAERWLNSLESHAMRTDPKIGSRCRSLAYGVPYPQLDREHHLNLYQSHLERVRCYFKHQPSSLLEVCWEEQASWQSLCTFLERPVPEVPFPHANAANSGNAVTTQRNQRQLAWYKQRWRN